MSSDSKDGLVAVSGVLMGLSVIAVGLRFYARKQQKLRYLTDDWMVIPALFTYIGATIAIIIAHQDKVLGYSLSDFSVEEQAKLKPQEEKIQIALDILQTTSLAFVKLSALFFYRRIFITGGQSKWFDIATKIFAAIIVLWLIIFNFLAGFQCGTYGIAALWDGTYLQNCTLSFPYLYGLTLSDFLLDIFILALPIPLVVGLHVTRAKKLSIYGIFLLAFVGLGASIARVVAIVQDELGGPAYFVTHDPERINTSYLFFVMLENGISLVAVNLPSLWLVCTSVIPDKVVRSVRSMASLVSLNSKSTGTNGYTKHTFADLGNLEKGRSTASSESQQRFVTPQSSGTLRDDLHAHRFDTYAWHLQSGGADVASIPKTAIHVQRTVELSRD